MSRKLGAVVLVMGILACSMGLRTALSSHQSSSAVLVANGPDQVPPMPDPPPPPRH